MRTAAGATTDQAADAIGLDRTKISNMESGVRATSADRVRTLAANYECTDTEYIEALASMSGGRKRGWWEQYRGMVPHGLLDVAELEWYANRLITFQTVHLPGLLHLSEYARAIFDAALPALPKSQVELRVALRIQRQQVLERSDPVGCVAYIHEAALRMYFGGERTTRAQLLHLCEMSELDNVQLRVLPAKEGAFPGAGHAVLYAKGPVAKLDTVQLDSAHGPEFTHAELQLEKYRAHLGWMDRHTLNTERSRDYIGDIARNL
jgi:transcriptional regulator with XRE-family HTH domain